MFCALRYKVSVYRTIGPLVSFGVHVCLSEHSDSLFCLSIYGFSLWLGYSDNLFSLRKDCQMMLHVAVNIDEI